MLVSLGAAHLFIGKMDREELTRVVLDGREPRDLVEEVVGPGATWLEAWEPVTQAVYRKICSYIAQQAADGKRPLPTRFTRLDYHEADAKHNVLDVLHAASLVSRQLRLIPHSRSFAEDLHNRLALGTPWHSLVGESATVLFNVRPRNKLQWIVDRGYDAELTFNVCEVEAVRGPLDRIAMVLRGVEFTFGQTWSVTLLEVPEATVPSR